MTKQIHRFEETVSRLATILTLVELRKDNSLHSLDWHINDVQDALSDLVEHYHQDASDLNGLMKPARKVSAASFRLVIFLLCYKK